jgi:hypothetical protein
MAHVTSRSARSARGPGASAERPHAFGRKIEELKEHNHASHTKLLTLAADLAAGQTRDLLEGNFIDSRAAFLRYS